MDDQLRRIEERFNDLEKKIAQLHVKHDGLINYILQPQKNSPPTPAQSGSGSTPSPSPQVPVTSVSPSAHTKSAKTAKPSSSHDLLPLVAVICFVLAGVFMVKLAVESGWLTVFRQWGLLSLLGLGLTAAGRYLPRVDNQYRSYLSAAGVIVLYMAAYSSSLYFQLFDHEVAIAFAIGVSLICLNCFHHHRSELFAIITSVGTYLSPLLLGQNHDLIFNTGFFLIWAAVFSTASTYLRTRTLALTASYLGMGVYTWMHSQVVDQESLGLVIGVLALQFFIFAYGVFSYSIRNKDPMAARLALAYLPVLLFFYGTEYYFMNRLSPDLAPWISLVFAGFIFALYQKAKKQMSHLQSEATVHAFLAAVLFHSGYLQILPASAKPWLLPLLILLNYIAERKDVYKQLSVFLRFCFLAIGIIEFAKICLEMLSNSDSSTIFPAFATIALGLFAYFRGSKLIQEKSYIFLGGLHIISVLAVYRLFFDYGSLAVSAAWAVYSATILGIGYSKRDVVLAKSSLLVLILAGLKALVYDASQTSSGVRILSLLLTGALLYGAGILFKKINQMS